MSSTRTIDWLVLTAANRVQARGYREQLRERERDGRLRGVAKWMVIADPGDRRVGSGGSTFVVLHALVRKIGGARRGGPAGRAMSAFAGKRILIVHAGGDSRRLPAYAAEGKAFVPLPRGAAGIGKRDGETLFDLVLEDLKAVVDAGRVVIATGDVYLGLAESSPDLTSRGIVGVAFAGAMDVASRHGVYVRGPGGRVKEFLQKPSREEARRRGAVARGKILIDTGVLSLDAEAAGRWVEASDAIVRAIVAGRERGVDLYSDVLPGIVNGEAGWRGFAAPFGVRVVPRCPFVHVGSTRELVDISSGRDVMVYNSVGSVRGGRGAVVEASRVEGRVRMGRRSVLVGFPGGAKLRIDDRLGMVFVPVGGREWACIVFGEEDDFKTPRERGGTVVNEPMGKWLSRVGIGAEEVLGSADQTLWSARLWVIGKLNEVVRTSGWMAVKGGRPTAEWRRARRVSMAELVPRVNVGRVLRQRAELRREGKLARAAAELDAGRIPSSAEVLGALRERAEAAEIGRAVMQRIERERRPFVRARLLSLAGAINARFAGAAGSETSRALEESAFACVAEGVARGMRRGRREGARRAVIRVGEVVRATCPVRVDLAGGWSDTPPLCQELGGTVVNAAMMLDWARPIEVTARLIPDPEIRVVSEDLGKSLTIREAAAVQSYRDPRDWAALPKAALVLNGIVNDGDMARRLKSFGGGLQLTMSAAVPKGSGLGTSSILGAAVLACLDRVCGRGESMRSLIERTSVLEQMISTAGGWQDQAGGLTPGIKILRTRPGADQVPRMERARVPRRAMRELRQRVVMYDTAQQRLARDILHGVVRRYLAGEADVVRIVRELKETAKEMARDLRRGDIDAFARGVLRNWDLKKTIDPGSTNRRIERVIDLVKDRLTGYELAGAGGGGFLFMIARSERDARAVKRELGGRRGRIVEFDVDERGLEVNVWECAPSGAISKRA